MAKNKYPSFYLAFFFLFIPEYFDVFLRFRAFAFSPLWTILKRYEANTFFVALFPNEKNKISNPILTKPLALFFYPQILREKTRNFDKKIEFYRKNDNFRRIFLLKKTSKFWKGICRIYQSFILKTYCSLNCQICQNVIFFKISGLFKISNLM